MSHSLQVILLLAVVIVAGLETDLVLMRHAGNVAFWSAFGGSRIQISSLVLER